MNSNPIETEVTDSGKSVHLPKPDADNITVLTPKLPNKPILPWTHFDSPWLETEESEEEAEVSAEQETETAENQENQSEPLTDPENSLETSENQVEAVSNPPENSVPEPEVPPNPSPEPENQVYFQIISEIEVKDDR